MDSSTQDFQLPLPGFDERRIYYFYRILNTVTGKSYVGVTLNEEQRKYAHFSKLKHNKHHSRKLQDSYNKYGVGVFSWGIIEQGLYTPTDAFTFEQSLIAQFDSYHHGYNASVGGLCGGIANAIRCEWNGIEYDSISECARSNGVHTTTMMLRFRSGYTCDDDIPPFEIPCVWNGVHYQNLNEAAIALGITPSSMGYRVAQGYVCDDDLTYGNIPVEWNGTTYDSISEAAKALGLTSGAIRRRVFEYGYKSDADMKGKEKPIIWNETSYPSVTIAAKTLGINRRTMYGRIRKGYKSDSDMQKK